MTDDYIYSLTLPLSSTLGSTWHFEIIQTPYWLTDNPPWVLFELTGPIWGFDLAFLGQFDQ
jgi:hypothetical protein